MAKLTQQEYETKISTKFPHIVVYGDYVDYNTQIWHYCLIHWRAFLVSPDNMNRTGRKGCLECSNKVRWTYLKLVTELALICFPDGTPRFLLLTSETDFNKNFKGAQTRIKLRCTLDGYEWETNINNLINGGYGCSRCSGKEEWTYEKLKNKLALFLFPDGTPRFLLLTTEDDFNKNFKGAQTRIILRCTLDGYEWETNINSLINGGTGCARCSGKEEWTYERLQEAISDLKFPDGTPVCTLELSESEFLEAYEIDGCSAKIPVRCAVHQDHYWSPMLNDLINNKSGCPHCNTTGYSKAEIEWIEFVMATEGIYIQHAKNGGQVSICDRSVDGMCYETNSVYQFHGDFWHGNPAKYNQNKIHPKYKEKGLTYGDKYKETLIKDQELRDQGYNVVIMWELEWKEIKK